MGQQQGERCNAEDREPDHGLTPDPVADRPAKERPRRYRTKEQEQVQLRTGDRQVELLDQVEGEIAGEAGHVEILGEHQQPEHHQRAGHSALGQAVSRCLTLLELEQVQVVGVPAADPVQHEQRKHREQAEPGHVPLAVRNDDRCRQ
ncbi:hypothetical protein D3C75_1020090 [compost metagenome]